MGAPLKEINISKMVQSFSAFIGFSFEVYTCSSKSGCQAGSGSWVEGVERLEERGEKLVVGKSGRGTVRGWEGREVAEIGPVMPMENTLKLYTWGK